MLRPLKTFLNYLQKNANGSDENSINMNEQNITKCADTVEYSSKSISVDKKNVVHNKTEVLSFKSDSFSSEVKPEIKNLTTTASSNSIENNFEKCNVVSVEIGENSVEDFHCGEIEYSTGELLLNDPLNSSNQSDPLSDPLAFDEFDCSEHENEITNVALEVTPTEVSSDVSSSNPDVLYIINVDEIKEKIVKSETNLEKNDIAKDSNQITTTEEQELRSDGSDSGLGSEIPVSNLNPSINNGIHLEALPKICLPLKSNLKRRSDLDLDSNLAKKKIKKSINFDGVKIYYFQRIQGFACVPSQGGCTLGMSARHINFKTFTLSEHAADQRRAHRLQMQEVNPKGSSSDEDSDSDEELSEGSGSDLDTDGSGFLQPVPAKQRRSILKAAGVRKIESYEKDECRAIRSSREFCGCNCRGFCDPDTCSCSQSGIKCQVDRLNFPCGCTRDGCANLIGRVEFNPARVRTHFIHTIMRLDIENKQNSTKEHETHSINSRSNLYSTNNNCQIDNANGHDYNNLNLENNRPQLYVPMQHMYHDSNYGNVIHNTENTFYNSTTDNSGSLSINPSCSFDQQQTITNNRKLNSDGILGTNNQMHHHNYGVHMTTNHLDNSRSTANSFDYSMRNNPSFSYNDTNYINENGYQNSTAFGNYQSNWNQNFLNSPQQNCFDENNLKSYSFNLNEDDSITANKYINLNPLNGNESRIHAINDLLHNNRNTPPVISTKIISNLDQIDNVIAYDPFNVESVTSISISNSSCTTSTQDTTAIVEVLPDALTSFFTKKNTDCQIDNSHENQEEKHIENLSSNLGDEVTIDIVKENNILTNLCNDNKTIINNELTVETKNQNPNQNQNITFNSESDAISATCFKTSFS